MLLSLGIILNTQAAPENIPDESLDKLINQVDQLLEKIPSEKLQETIVMQEKKKIIAELITFAARQENPNQVTEKKDDDYFFAPKYPDQLTEIERELSVHSRIKQHYIGKIPDQIEDAIFYFSHHQECIEKKVDIFNRVLLYGRPGTGKTYLVKVLAHALQIPYLSFSASFFADKYIGESSKRIRKAFDAAKKMNGPVLIFIDEIDALASQRRESTHDEHRATLITLLTELQELQTNKNIFVIAATNQIYVLDQAIIDRFAGSIAIINELNQKERSELFQKLFKEKNHPIESAFADRLAEVTQDSSGMHLPFSNRDIEYIVTTTLLKKLADCTQNKDHCNKHLCSYARLAIDKAGKKATYANYFPTYGDGI